MEVPRLEPTNSEGGKDLQSLHNSQQKHTTLDRAIVPDYSLLLRS
jgi:hypothetical protein